MTVRITGMVSGLDTESLITELVSAYSKKKDKFVKAQTKLSWKQDAWKSLNSKVYSLYTSVSSLRFSSAYNLKSTSISDATKATVVASSNAVNGTQSLKVNQLATAGYLTGGVVSTTDGSKAKSDSSLADLGFSGSGTINLNGTEISISSSMTVNELVNQMKSAGVNASFDEDNQRFFVSSKDSGTENEFTLTASDSGGSTALSVLGLNASSSADVSAYLSGLSGIAVFSDTNGNSVTYDSSAGYTVTSSNGVYTLTDGSGNSYSYDATATQEQVKSLLQSGSLIAASYGDSSYVQAAKTYQYATQLNGGDSTELDAYNSYKSAKAKVDALSDVNVALYESIKDLSTEDLEKAYVDSEDASATITTITEEDGSVSYTDSNGVSLTADANGNLSGTDADGNTVTYTRADNKLSELESAFTSAGVTYDEYTTAAETVANYTSEHDANAIAAMETVAAANSAGTLSTTISDALDTASASYMNKVTSSLSGATAAASSSSASNSSQAVRVSAQDAEIELNGAIFTGSSNTFTVNGLTITALAKTTDAVSITTSTDTQGIYDKVKDFLSTYNSVINEMNSLYNAASAKGYDPLTNDEKDAMTDTQIEEWEAKIKKSLLRRDTTLGGLITNMTNAMSKSYFMGKNTAGSYITFTLNSDGNYDGNDGKTYSLTSRTDGNTVFTATDGTTITASSYSWSTLGISTLGLLNAAANEGYAYHIDGDEDDSYSSGKTDKLMAMINKDPEAVIELLKNATSSLYSSIDSKMKSTSLRSAYTVYNDKEMAKEYSDYTSTIKKWEEKIKKEEDYYYKKFAAMESALATIQGNASSLSSLLS